MNAKTKERPKTIAERDKWVAEMQVHFQRTGAYRAEDIIRVLGNPLESVEVRPAKQFSFGKIAD
jgi:hypothetical protein